MKRCSFLRYATLATTATLLPVGSGWIACGAEDLGNQSLKNKRPVIVFLRAETVEPGRGNAVELGNRRSPDRAVDGGRSGDSDCFRAFGRLGHARESK